MNKAFNLIKWVSPVIILGIIIMAFLIFTTSCSTYTCPTYASNYQPMYNVKQPKVKQQILKKYTAKNIKKARRFGYTAINNYAKN